jgi:tetratricopeptide (TPR) repeat protein
MRLILSSLLAVAVICTVPSSGFAQSKGKQAAEGYYNKGMTAYSLGHFSEAIEEFEKAYAATPNAAFLFNIAQSHRQSGNPQRAVFFYRRYLEAEPQAKNRPDVERRIKDLEAQIEAAQEQKEQAAVAPPPVVRAEPAVVSPAAEKDMRESSPPPAITLQESSTLSPRASRRLRVAGIATAGAGVAVIGAGVFFYLQARSLHQDAYSGTFDSSKHDSSSTYLTLSRASFGVGSAAILAGAALYYVGYRARPAAGTVAVVPFPAPGGGGAGLVGRF